MNDIIKRYNIYDLYKIKISLTSKIKKLQETDELIDEEIRLIQGYKPYRIDYNEREELKYIDCVCWRYLVGMYELEKYMLCTDYKKMQKEINEYKTPEFTIENAKGWIDGLKQLIFDNVSLLIKQVFKSITESTYYTGSGYSNRQEKKRNNNGIDKSFIIHTFDYSSLFGYSYREPTITDDLEKACYILSGEKLPEITCKDIMRKENKTEFGNEYFYLKVCKNGNTHYQLNDDIRNKLNLYGSESGVIGEKIKIKIFEKLF